MTSKNESGIASLETATQAWQAAAAQGKQLYLTYCIEGPPSIAILDLGEGSPDRETLHLTREDGQTLAETLKAAFEHKVWESPVDGKIAFTDHRFFTNRPKAPAV